MNENAWLAERFEDHRGRLKAVASRMLGSSTEADDAVQETWLRFSRADTTTVDNLGGWLTTVVSRVCLNMLQARRSRPAVPADPDLPDSVDSPISDSDPEQEAIVADSVGLALLVVLDTLTPAERVALVLHDMFGVPFDDIGPIVGRSAPAARQLASRGRRRVRGHTAPEASDRARQAHLVEAFIAAARNGDFEGLLALLDPGIVFRADETAVSMGAPPEVRGAAGAAQFLRRARGALPALVDGMPGAVWAPRGRLRVVLRFAVGGGKITGVDAVADADDLSRIDLVLTGQEDADSR
jgi:RNA polymerase sigma-70 factor (ECF subfamily)